MSTLAMIYFFYLELIFYLLEYILFFKSVIEVAIIVEDNLVYYRHIHTISHFYKFYYTIIV